MYGVGENIYIWIFGLDMIGVILIVFAPAKLGIERLL